MTNTTRTVAKKSYPKFGPSIASVTRNGVRFSTGCGEGRVPLADLIAIMELGDVDIVTSWRGEEFRVERTAKAFVTTGRFAFDGIK
jgi:hypothetical protein